MSCLVQVRDARLGRWLTAKTTPSLQQSPKEFHPTPSPVHSPCSLAEDITVDWKNDREARSIIKKTWKEVLHSHGLERDQVSLARAEWVHTAKNPLSGNGAEALGLRLVFNCNGTAFESYYIDGRHYAWSERAWDRIRTLLTDVMPNWHQGLFAARLEKYSEAYPIYHIKIRDPENPTRGPIQHYWVDLVNLSIAGWTETVKTPPKSFALKPKHINQHDAINKTASRLASLVLRHAHSQMGEYFSGPPRIGRHISVSYADRAPSVSATESFLTPRYLT